MSYAANLGRDEIIKMLHKMGATDHVHALDRAALQSKIDTARLLARDAGFACHRRTTRWAALPIR